MAKLTTKTTKPSGRFGYMYVITEIKLNGVRCGSISQSSPHQITLSVFKEDLDEDKNPNCPFKNIHLAAKFESVAQAKAWLSEKSEILQAKYNIYALKD